MCNFSILFRRIFGITSLFILMSGCGTLQSLSDSTTQAPYLSEPKYPTGNKCYDSCTIEYRDCLNDAANLGGGVPSEEDHSTCLQDHAACAKDC